MTVVLPEAVFIRAVGKIDRESREALGRSAFEMPPEQFFARYTTTRGQVEVKREVLEGFIDAAEHLYAQHGGGPHSDDECWAEVEALREYLD